MKSCIIFSTLFALSLSSVIQDRGLEFKLDKVWADNFLSENEEKLRTENDIGEITAICNEYADKIFVNIGKFALSHKLDPVGLGNVSENFLGSSITLNNGSLNGISTIQRYDDVKVSYQHSLKKLSLTVPLLFTNLNFTYHYHVILLLVGPEGGMTGKIQNFRLNVNLTFDFNKYHAKLETLKTTNSGSITLTFDGNGVIDAVVNILSQFVTGVLHPLLTGIIEGIVKTVANTIVVDVNAFLDKIFHNNSTALAEQFIKNNFIIV